MYTLVPGGADRCLQGAFSGVSFHIYDKTSEQSTLWKIHYFGSWVHRFQSMVTEIHDS